MLSRLFLLSLVIFITAGCGSKSPTVDSESADSSQSEAETFEPGGGSAMNNAAGETDDPSPAKTSADGTNDGVIEMTAIEWKQLSEKNGYNLSHLNGKRIRLSGQVGDVGLDSVESPVPTVTFRAADGFWSGLTCYIPGLPLWDSVQPGQQLTLEYTHSDESEIYPQDCKVVSVTGSPASVIEAQDLVDAYVQNEADLNQRYTVDFKSRRLGLAGKVREVIRPEVGPVLIVFETESSIPVTADMLRRIADTIQLPSKGEYFRVWGSYSRYTPPKDGEDVNLYVHSFGVLSAVPFPAK